MIWQQEPHPAAKQVLFGLTKIVRAVTESSVTSLGAASAGEVVLVLNSPVIIILK